MTAASAMPGWVRRRASSSAGATWKPLYLMSSLYAVDDEQPALGVHVAHVSGAQPAVRVDHRGGGFGLPQIAPHDLGTADDDLARLPDAEVLVGVVEGDDAHLGARDEPADRSRGASWAASRGTRCVQGDSSVSP